MIENIKCYICAFDAEKDKRSEGTFVNCTRCGEYWIKGRFPTNFIGELNDQQMANISHWVRHNQSPHEAPIIDLGILDALKNLKTPTVPDKAERFILLFANMYPKPGTNIKTRTDEISLLAKIGCIDKQELEYIINDYLSTTKKYLENVNIDSRGSCVFKISPDGWAYIESLKNINPESQIAFVAMWFDDSVREVYEQGIKKGIEDAGYEPLRIDLLQHNNRIDDEIIANIRTSKFLVADLAGQRGGVYFEAGYAMGLGLPVIWTCSKKELDDVHFDTRQYYFITWEEDKLEELTNNLRYRIEATIGKGSYKPEN